MHENFAYGESMHNLEPDNNEIPIPTYSSRQQWWEKLTNLYNNSCVRAYNPTWERLCPKCGSQLLLSESKNFCCNDILRRTILPLRPLPLILQNLYLANPDNFSHNSHQYNSLFTFTILGVVRLPHPHVFAINGRAYHQVYPANVKGYPANWFVYDADVRDDVVNQRRLNQKIVNLIKHELTAVNPFVEGLRQLYNVDYPQARLIIQQPTNNAKVAACTIVHSTAVIQERYVHIWRVGEENPTYISILDENYEALQYPLFFPHGEIGWRMY
ncbi:ATP-dependent DNA helicase pif1 [Gigaspora margarita]|uniref:ATP-dependent DNA helicase pif1 n=1 Tax=Gigaspora margarita TaxID=4874 RepID=A0A8H4B1D9_GIGMA|nr:ATP-dependent DNA helicase pif1 [Gigaspora margarita]